MIHDVQTAALGASRNRYGFGWFMEQGLGKTYTDWLEFQRLVEAHEVSRKVVLAPNSFKSGWGDEAEKWGFETDVHVFESGSNTNALFLKKKWKAPPTIVVNYEAIRSDATQELLTEFMMGANNGAMITADESIQLKGFDTQQTVAAIQLAKRARYRRILTGKPIVQGPHDLWGQMRFIGALENKPYYAFKTAFCRMGGFKAKQVVGAQNEEILAELIEPHVFRATKADWTDLPPKVYTIRDYKLSPELLSMYRSMFDDFVVWLESGEAVTVEAAITKYEKLTQIQAGFIINEQGDTRELVPPTKNPRVGLLKDLIATEVVGKVAIPYRHRYVRGMLADQLAVLRPAAIAGGMTPEEIQSEKRRFNEDPECRVILLQTSAAKYGHTLLGGPEPENHCSTMIFFENTYSGDDRSQIEDRPHRHGQLGSVMSYFDLSGTSMDKAMLKAQATKEAIFQAVFKNIRSFRE